MRLSLVAAALASALTLCEGASSKMVIGYLPNWLYANYPVEQVPFNKYTHINYAFAILNNQDNLPSFTDDWAVESSLPKIVNMAHANKTKVLLSVGGWTGSQRFSPMVATAESRKKFIEWNVNFIEKYNTDGVDLDWEYPGKQAAGCNMFADDDADNFLLLLKELRQALDAKFPDTHKEISMAVHVQPFVKNGTPMNDVKEYVPYFDHINLMTYDINGAWATTTGPNAPFEFEEGKGAPYSFVRSIQDWKAAGVPSEKITAGLAFYGRTMKAKEDMTTQRSQFQLSEAGAPKGDSDDAYWTDPYCNVEAGGLSGIWKWSNLRKEGLLKDDTLTAGEGWQRYWDEVTQTPWLFNPATKHFISYDDPQSLKIKVEHALCEDLAGVMVWDIHQDNGELIDVVSRVHDATPVSCSKPTALKNNQPDKIIEDKPEEIVNASKDIGHLGSSVEEASSESDSVEQNSPIDELEFEESEDWIDEQESSEANVTGVVSDELPSTSSPASVEIVSTSQAPESSATDSTFSSIDATGNEKSPQEGQSCSTTGEQKCVDSGVSGKWLTCNIGTWIVRECSNGLVCSENQGAVICDYPSSQITQEDSFNGGKSILPEGGSPLANNIVEPLADAIISKYTDEEASSHHNSLPIVPSLSADSNSLLFEDSVSELSDLAFEEGIDLFKIEQATLAVQQPQENAQLI